MVHGLVDELDEVGASQECFGARVSLRKRKGWFFALNAFPSRVLDDTYFVGGRWGEARLLLD